MSFALPPDVTLVDTENGVVLLDQRNGRYWLLNNTGATMLRLLLDGFTPEAAVARMGREFPDDTDRISADLAALLAELQKADLVETR